MPSDNSKPKSRKSPFGTLRNIGKSFWKASPKVTSSPFRSSSPTKSPKPFLQHTLGIQRTHFRDLKQLGKGGYGSVLLSRHIATDRAVALKVVQGYHPFDTRVSTVLHEKEAMTRLRGVQGMAQLYGAGSDSKNVFIVMELYSKGSYQDELLRMGRIGEERAIHRFAETVRAFFTSFPSSRLLISVSSCSSS
jgi:serine/threonine protein kinase